MPVRTIFVRFLMLFTERLLYQYGTQYLAMYLHTYRSMVDFSNVKLDYTSLGFEPESFACNANALIHSALGVLYKLHVKYDLRKFGFVNRVVNTWNSLPNWVVSANTTNTFKSRLDKFWQNQDVIYNFKAQLHGTESRSKSRCDSIN